MLKIVFCISVTYIIIYDLYLGGTSALAIRRKHENRYLFLFSLALACFGCSVTPSGAYDLYRHYQYIDTVRQMKPSFTEYMFDNHNILGGGSRSSLYGFKLLIYIISKLESNRWLPFITILAVYLIWSYITTDWLTTKKRLDLLLPSLLFCVSVMPFIYVNTGIRNSLAASIAGLALYNEFVKKNNPILTLITLLVACTFHSALILVIPCWIIAHFKFNLKVMIAIIVALLLLDPVAQILCQVGTGTIQTIAWSYLVYSRDSSYFYSAGYLVIDIAFLLIVLCFLFPKRNAICSEESKLYNFFLTYACIIVGQIGHYDLVLRPMYVFAILSGPITYYIFMALNRKGSKQLIYLLSFVCFFIALYIHGRNYLTICYF